MNALVGRAKKARALVNAAKAKLPEPERAAETSAHRDLLIVVDIAIGLRDKPAELAGWWEGRPAARACIRARRGRAPRRQAGDPAFLEALCK